MPRFPKVSCSQCGRDFGPGDHGFSHCHHHADRHGPAASSGALTLFQFYVDYTANEDGSPVPDIKSVWAPNARAALDDAMAQLGGKHFHSLEGVEPMPYRVKLDGESLTLASLGFTAHLCALLILAEQSSCATPAEMRAFIREITDEPEAVSARLVAEWTGREQAPRDDVVRERWRGQAETPELAQPACTVRHAAE